MSAMRLSVVLLISVLAFQCTAYHKESELEDFERIIANPLSEEFLHKAVALFSTQNTNTEDKGWANGVLEAEAASPTISTPLETGEDHGELEETTSSPEAVEETPCECECTEKCTRCPDVTTLTKRKFPTFPTPDYVPYVREDEPYPKPEYVVKELVPEHNTTKTYRPQYYVPTVEPQERRIEVSFGKAKEFIAQRTKSFRYIFPGTLSPAPPPSPIIMTVPGVPEVPFLKFEPCPAPTKESPHSTGCQRKGYQAKYESYVQPEKEWYKTPELAPVVTESHVPKLKTEGSFRPACHCKHSSVPSKCVKSEPCKPKCDCCKKCEDKHSGDDGDDGDKVFGEADRENASKP